MFRNCFPFNSLITHIFHVNFIFDVPIYSSVIEEQLTRPRSGKPERQSHTDIVLGLYSLLRKMGLQNVGKFSHFGMVVLRRGVGVKKETAIGRFA